MLPFATLAAGMAFSRRGIKGFRGCASGAWRVDRLGNVGRRIKFAGLIELLKGKALEMQATDPALYLRVIGIDATQPADYHDARRSNSATIKV
jgi:hypothetical protein